MSEGKELNVKDWITLSSVMIGAVLTILALIWQQPPPSGIVLSTFLLMISFIFFVNSVSTNSKAYFEAKAGKISDQKLEKWTFFAEYTFGVGFTCVICAFAILGYEYLIVFLGGRFLLALILPITFIVTALCLMIIYNVINYDGTLAAFKNMKRNIWAIIEIVCIVFIILDFAGIIIIP